MDREPGGGHTGLSQGFPFPLRSLLEQLKKLQAIVVQSTSKSAQTGTCIAVSGGVSSTLAEGPVGEEGMSRSRALSAGSSMI